MPQKLWEANLKVKNKSNLLKFEKFLSKKFNYKVSKNYKKIFNWSIKNLNLFWSSVWDYTNVKGKKNEKFKFTKDFLKNKFFIKSKLNFDDYWKEFWENDRTILMTKEEHNLPLENECCIWCKWKYFRFRLAIWIFYIK